MLRRLLFILVPLLLASVATAGDHWPNMAGGGARVPGASAGDLVASDGGRGFTASDCSISGNVITCDANAATGQCTTLLEGSDNGSESTTVCASYDIDQSDTDFLPDMVLGAGASSFVQCFWDAEAVNLDAGECPAGIRVNCPVITGDAEDCTLELFAMGNGAEQVFLTLDGGYGFASQAVEALASSIDAADLDDRLCASPVSLVLDIAQNATEYHSLNQIDTSTGNQANSVTQTDVDNFVNGAELNIADGSFIANLDAAPGGGESCSFTLHDGGVATTNTCTATTTPICNDSDGDTIEVNFGPPGTSIEVVCSSGSAATEAILSWCWTP